MVFCVTQNRNIVNRCINHHPHYMMTKQLDTEIEIFTFNSDGKKYRNISILTDTIFYIVQFSSWNKAKKNETIQRKKFFRTSHSYSVYMQYILNRQYNFLGFSSFRYIYLHTDLDYIIASTYVLCAVLTNPVKFYLICVLDCFLSENVRYNTHRITGSGFSIVY